MKSFELTFMGTQHRHASHWATYSEDGNSIVYVLQMMIIDQQKT